MMHIEPGIVTGAKIALGYATSAGAGLWSLKQGQASLRDGGAASLIVRSVMTTALVFVFFQILPRVPVGVSEVHFILGSTLFLLFGAAPAAIGLAAGLALQGVFFAPTDLPQYGMNVTTLLLPLFAISALARRMIAPGTAYVDLGYRQALALSTVYQGGVVAWVAFWALYGQGLAGVPGVVTFGAAYMMVVLLEPLVDLAVLAAAKSVQGLRGSRLVNARLFA